MASHHAGRATASTAWISWLRVVAILGVISIHTVGSTAAADGARESPVGRVAIVLDIAAIASVPMFVMLSGALLLDPERYRGPRDFLRRRAVRLLPAIVFWHLWYLGVRLLRGDDLTVAEVVERVVTGELYTQLYFLWIVLGLAAVTPVLMPLVRRWGRGGAAVAGAAGVLLTAVAASERLPIGWAQTAVTWWLPYLGLYLLGWALRGVRVRGIALAALTIGTAGLGALLCWQWRNDAAPDWLQHIAPVSYYGGGVALYAMGLFLCGRALLADDGVLRRLSQAPMAAVGRVLGDATLGVFGIHLTVIAVLTATGLLGGNNPAPDVATLLARVAVVAVASYAVVLPLRRIPVVRAVL